jgi:hypothetical protein
MFYIILSLLLALTQEPTNETYYSSEQNTEVNQNSDTESTDDSSSEETGQDDELEPNP